MPVKPASSQCKKGIECGVHVLVLNFGPAARTCDSFDALQVSCASWVLFSPSSTQIEL